MSTTLPGTGTLVATDDGGAEGVVQFVKLTQSATGQAAPIQADANGLLVSLGSSTVNVTESATVLTGAAAQTAAVNNILPSVSGAAGTNTQNIRAASVQVVSTGTGGTFIFEQSLDGTNWVALPVFNAALTTGVPITAAITATASAIVYTFPVRAAQIRLRIVTPITGGSIQAFSRLSSDPWTPTVTTVAQPTAASLLTTATVTGYPTAAASADALANPTVTQIGALGLNFNGTTWDRVRNNANVTVDTSAARTTSGNGATATNFNAAGAFIFINVTAASGTPSMTVRVQWSPDGGTTWLDLDTTNAQTAAITGVSTTVLRIYPGIATAANASLNAPLPRTWRLAWTITGGTPSLTFATSASYIL